MEKNLKDILTKIMKYYKIENNLINSCDKFRSPHFYGKKLKIRLN